MDIINQFLPFIFILIAGGSVYFFRGDLKGKLRETLSQFKQKENNDKISSLKQSQVKVDADIKDLEKTSIETQKKIRDEIDKSAERIQQYLKEDTVKSVDNNADKDWSNL